MMVIVALCGVPDIFAQAQEANLPESKIEELAGRVRFTMGLAEPLPLMSALSRRPGAGDALPRMSLSVIKEPA